MSKDKESEFYTEKAFTELLAYSDCMTRFASQKPGTAFAAASVFFLSAFSWLPSSGEHLRTNDPTRRSRSEEHTSELQSRLHLVCRLLLEKKKTIVNTQLVLDNT